MNRGEKLARYSVQRRILLQPSAPNVFDVNLVLCCGIRWVCHGHIALAQHARGDEEEEEIEEMMGDGSKILGI